MALLLWSACARARAFAAVHGVPVWYALPPVLITAAPVPVLVHQVRTRFATR